MRVKNKSHLAKRESIVKFIGFIVFIAILMRVFSSVTYIFRNTGYNRKHIIEIKNENLDLDMVYIGGSAAFVYWQPLKAWNDCGFTSYLYATDTAQAENIKAYIEEVRKNQDPDLFLVDLRPFQYYSNEEKEAGLRNGTDGMDLMSYNRLKLINEYFSNRNISEETEILSYYLDIIKYHTNIKNLSSNEAWELKTNRGRISINKGWEWIDSYIYLDTPENFDTEIRGELPSDCKSILIELLDYCEKEKLRVLFVVCPYYISVEDEKKYNTIGDIIEYYGFDYLNANLYYKEIGIDFSTDFYNKDHVNLFGAEKYTEFLESYISENYTMPDHRNDEAYEAWNENYKQFLEEKKVHSDIVTNMRIEAEKGLEIATQMSQADTLFEWNDLVEDDRFTILVTAVGNMEWPRNIADQKFLGKWDFSEADTNGMRVISNNNIVYSSDKGENTMAEGEIGKWSDHSYCLSTKDNTSSIIIDEKEYSLNQKGINVVVFDNNFNKVVESALIYNKDGKLYIK